jgi:hypothetical protein
MTGTLTSAEPGPSQGTLLDMLQRWDFTCASPMHLSA